STATRNIDLLDVAVVTLSSITRNPHEVARNTPFSVIAHWMGCVATQCQDRSVTIPKANHLQPRIYSPLRLRSNRGISRRASSVEQRSRFRPDIAPVRGHVFNARFSKTKVGHPATGAVAGLHRLRYTLNGCFMKLQVADGASCLGLAKKLLSCKIRNGCVM